jgi:hypothetical protein
MRFSEKLVECCDSYRNSNFIFTNGVKNHLVEFPDLADFNKARLAFAKNVKSLSLDDDWNQGASLFNLLHAKLARTPCAPSWLLNHILNSDKSIKTIRQIESRASNVDPSIARSYEKIQSSLDKLKKIDENPLLLPIKDILLDNQKSLIVLRDLSLLEEVRLSISKKICYDITCWEILKPSSLRSHQNAQRLLIFGPAWHLSYRNEDFLLRAPAAPEIHLISCSHENGGDVMLTALDSKKTLNIEIDGDKKPRISNINFEFEPFAQSGNHKFTIQQDRDSNIWEKGKMVLAVPFKFACGKGTILKKESEVWTVLTDHTKNPPVCSWVEKIPVEDLDTGDILLLPTAGGGDLIPAVADSILPNSQTIRGLQQKWKSGLLNCIENQGIENIVKKLTKFGSATASPTNVKNWCNPRSIAMEKLDVDLPAVLKLLDMVHQIEEVASGIAALRGAHQSAGMQLKKTLRNSIVGMQISEVFQSGFMPIAHEGGPEVTLFLIEERGDDIEVSEDIAGEIKDVI